MDPDAWSYVAEGGKHAVFANARTPSDPTAANGPRDEDGGRDEHQGWVMRVAKSDLAAAAAEAGAAATEVSSTLPTAPSPCPRAEPEGRSSAAAGGFVTATHNAGGSSRINSSSIRHLRNVVIPLLGPEYVDAPRPLMLSAKFASELWRNAIECGRIPNNRMASWHIAVAGKNSRETSNRKDCDGKDVGNEANATVGQAEADSGLIVEGKEGIECGENDIPATLLVDYTSPRLPPDVPTVPLPAQPAPSMSDAVATIAALAVEIKPKAGYVACSPLIHPHRRVKLHKTRYAIHQRLLADGHIKRGWGAPGRRASDGGNGGGGISTYDPLDLFSDEPQRIKNALRNLFKHPQNNLRVWHGGGLVFGHELLDLGVGTARDALSGAFPGCFRSLIADDGGAGRRGSQNLIEVIVHIVTNVLVHERILSRILRAQLLDTIDADGAMAVYERLVQLCGSNDEAEKLVEEYRALTDSMESSASPCRDAGDGQFASAAAVQKMAVSPYPDPPSHPSGSLAELRERLAAFRAYVQSCKKSGGGADLMGLDGAYLDAARQGALDTVDQLSAEECSRVLADWLLAMAMSDLSLFVTLQPMSVQVRQRLCCGDDSNGYDNGRRGGDDSSINEQGDNITVDDQQESSYPRISSWQLQQEGRPGFFSLDCNCDCDCVNAGGKDLQQIMGFAYSIKVVDCDPKPAVKLRRREDDERKIELHPG